MSDTITVSERGQITLPAQLRKKLGIAPGSVVRIEEQNGAVVLRPAAVLPIETYSDADIARWLEDDKLTPRVEAKLNKIFKRAASRDKPAR